MLLQIVLIEVKNILQQSDVIVPADIFATSENDLPCDLCEQLLTHLKDILIANSTEEEFKDVLEVLCKQMGTYQDEVIFLNYKIEIII